jgi:NitT/TauT family transport system substrate-binding protein
MALLNQTRRTACNLSPAIRLLFKIITIGIGVVTSAASVALAQVDTVSLFMPPTPDVANIFVARDKGFFEAERIKLDLRLFPSGTAATDGFRSGKVDFVLAGEIPSMRLCTVMDAKVIASNNSDGFSPVFMVKSSIKAPEDLRGKTFATRIGSSVELFVDLFRAKFKLDADTFKVTNLEPADMVAALDRGDIDGFFWLSPFEERAQQISGAKVRLFTRGDDVGYTNEGAIVTRSDLIAQNPDLVIRFLRAFVKASDYTMSNPEDAGKVVMAALKIDAKDVDVIKKMTFPGALDKRVHDRYGFAIEFMSRKKMLDKPLDLATCFWTKGLETIQPSRVSKPN